MSNKVIQFKPIDSTIKSVTSASNCYGSEAREKLNEYSSSELGRRLAKPIQLPFNVSPPVLKHMNELFSPLLLTPSDEAIENGVTNAHPIPAATTLLMQREIDKIGGDEFGGKITCKFDNGIHENIADDEEHPSCLNVDARDEQRVIKAIALGERGGRLKNYLSNSGCVAGAHNCTQPARYLKCINVLFWLTMGELFKLFRIKGTMRLVSGMVFPKGLLEGESVTDFESGVILDIDEKNDKASMSFINDWSFPYIHSLKTWRQYARAGIVSGREYGCEFNLLIERTKNFGMGSIVEITRCQRGLKLDVIPRTITNNVRIRNIVTFLPQLAKYSMYKDTFVGKLRGNYFELNRIKQIFDKMPVFHVPEAILSKMEQFLFNRKDTDIDRHHVGSFLSASLHEVTVGFFEIQKGCLLSLESFTDLCITILIRSFIARSKASKSIAFGANKLTKTTSRNYLWSLIDDVFNTQISDKASDVWDRQMIKKFAENVMGSGLKVELVRRMITNHEMETKEILKSVAQENNLLTEYPEEKILTFNSPNTGYCYHDAIKRYGICSELPPYPTRLQIDQELEYYEDDFNLTFKDGHAVAEVTNSQMCEHLTPMCTYNVVPEPSVIICDMQDYVNKNRYVSLPDNTNYHKTALALLLLDSGKDEIIMNVAAAPMNDAGLWTIVENQVEHWYNTGMSDALIPLPPPKQTIEFNRNLLCHDCLTTVRGNVYADFGSAQSKKFLPFMQLEVLQNLQNHSKKFVMKWQDFVGTMENPTCHTKIEDTSVVDILKEFYIYYAKCLKPGEVYITNFKVDCNSLGIHKLKKIEEYSKFRDICHSLREVVIEELPLIVLEENADHSDMDSTEPEEEDLSSSEDDTTETDSTISEEEDCLESEIEESEDEQPEQYQSESEDRAIPSAPPIEETAETVMERTEEIEVETTEIVQEELNNDRYDPLLDIEGSYQEIVGNITKYRADYWVNSANEKLRGGGGIDGAIHKAAGHHNLINDHKVKYLNPGEISITGGFKSQADKIIHVVSPRKADWALYEKTVDAALCAVEVGKSVFVPIIGKGIFGLDPAICTEITRKVCKTHASFGKHVSLIDIVPIPEKIEIEQEIQIEEESKEEIVEELLPIEMINVLYSYKLLGEIPTWCGQHKDLTVPDFLKKTLIKYDENTDFGGKIQKNKFFSNYQNSIIHLGGIAFPHVEGCYQYNLKGIQIEKALHPNPQEAKKAGAEIKMCCHQHAIKVMANALQVKFSKKNAYETLQNTKGTLLRERSAKDKFWAINYQGEGSNVLGKLLTLIRDQDLPREAVEVQRVKNEDDEEYTLEQIMEILAGDDTEYYRPVYDDLPATRKIDGFVQGDIWPALTGDYIFMKDIQHIGVEMVKQLKLEVLCTSIARKKNKNIPFDGVVYNVVDGLVQGLLYTQKEIEFRKNTIRFPKGLEPFRTLSRELKNEKVEIYKKTHKICHELINDVMEEMPESLQVMVMEGTYGSGKTYQMKKLIQKMYRKTHSYLVVTPNSALAKEYKDSDMTAHSWSAALVYLKEHYTREGVVDRKVDIFVDEAFLLDTRIFRILGAFAKKMWLIGDSRQLLPGDGKKSQPYPLLENMLTCQTVRLDIAQKTPLDVVHSLNKVEPSPTFSRSRILHSVEVKKVPSFKAMPDFCKVKCKENHEHIPGAVFDTKHSVEHKMQTVAQIQGCRYKTFSIVLTNNCGALITRAHGQKLVAITRHTEKLIIYEGLESMMHNKLGLIEPMLDQTIIAGRNDVPTLYGNFDVNDVDYRNTGKWESEKIKVATATEPTDFVITNAKDRLQRLHTIKEKAGREVVLTLPHQVQVQAAVFSKPYYPVHVMTDNSEEIRVEEEHTQNMLENSEIKRFMALSPDAPTIDHIIKKVAPTCSPLANNAREISINTMRNVHPEKQMVFKNHTALVDNESGTTIAGLASLFGHQQKITPTHSMNTCIERAASKPIKKDNTETKKRGTLLFAALKKFVEIEKLRPPTMEEFGLCRAQAEIRNAAKKVQPEPSIYGESYNTTDKISCFNKVQLKAKVGKEPWLTAKEDELGAYVKGGQMVSAQTKNVNQITGGWVNWAERMVFNAMHPFVVPGYGRSPRTFRRKILKIIKPLKGVHYEARSIDLSEQDTLKDSATNYMMRKIYQLCGVPENVINILESPNHKWTMSTQHARTNVHHHFQSGRMDTLFSNTMHVLAEVGKSYDIHEPQLVLAQGDDVYLRANKIERTMDFTEQIKEDKNLVGDFVGFLIGNDDIYLDIPRIALKQVSKTVPTKERREELRVAISDLMNSFSQNNDYHNNMVANVSYKYGLKCGDVEILYDYLMAVATDQTDFKERANMNRIALSTVIQHFNVKRADY